MNKLLSLFFLLSASLSFSQKKIEGAIKQYDYDMEVKSEFDGSYFSVIQNKSYAISDVEGNIIFEKIDLCYGLSNFDKFQFLFGLFPDYNSEKDAFRLVSIKEKKPLTDYIYKDFLAFKDSTMLLTKKDNKEYVYVDNELNELAAFNEKNNKSRIFNDFNLKYSPERKYGSIKSGLAIFQDRATNKYGYLDKAGTIVIEPKYLSAFDFTEGLAVVKDSKELYGFIDLKGNMHISAEYTNIPSVFKNGLARVKSKTGDYGYINKSNEVVIEPKYDYATNYYKNRALVRQSRTAPIQLINEKGDILQKFDPKLTVIFKNPVISGGMLSNFSTNASLAHVNETLKQLVDYKKGVFYKGVKQGIVNLQGEIVLAFEYAVLKDYNGEFMLAIYENKNIKHHGLMNDKGEFVVEVVESKF